MTIRTMTLSDLEMALGWARDEGWNPGLDDASAFFAADPQGFFLAEVDGRPAAAISVVNHDAANAFLGLYICRPEFRGQGHGFALWQAALRHAGTRSVGLDGVPDQQENYAHSGFARLGRTIRYRGTCAPGTAPIRAATKNDLPALIAADGRAAGHPRPAYATAWLTDTPTRQTRVLERDGTLAGFATFRRCHEGVKIGPLHAETAADAQALLGACPPGFPAAPLFVDVPEGSALRGLVEGLGFEPVFETARMVRSTAPEAHPPAYHGVMTLELG